MWEEGNIYLHSKAEAIKLLAVRITTADFRRFRVVKHIVKICHCKSVTDAAAIFYSQVSFNIFVLFLYEGCCKVYRPINIVTAKLQT